jgi:hypothetical protein
MPALRERHRGRSVLSDLRHVACWLLVAVLAKVVHESMVAEVVRG